MVTYTWGGSLSSTYGYLYLRGGVLVLHMVTYTWGGVLVLHKVTYTWVGVLVLHKVTYSWGGSLSFTYGYLYLRGES